MANYGSAPYEESTFRKALRMLTAGAAGWGAVRPGSNFGEAFLSAGGRSAIAAQQASQAATDYAIRMEEVKRRREEDATQQKYTEALIEQMKRPAPPEKPEKDPRPWHWQSQYWDVPGAAELRKKDTYIKPEEPKKSDKDTPTAGQRNQVFEAVRLINSMDANDPDDQALLVQILKNPPTPEEGEAARKKLMLSPGGPGGVGEVYRRPTLKKAK